MNILSELGLNKNEIIWQDLANCRGVAGELLDADGEAMRDSNGERIVFDPLFDSYENDVEPFSVRKATDAMCAACPVRKNCLDFGRDNGETGVYGGIYLTNGLSDRTRNEHKTKSDWAEIRGELGTI
jgi:hypothetical protein